jgi:hypothetical protein
VACQASYDRADLPSRHLVLIQGSNGCLAKVCQPKTMSRKTKEPAAPAASSPLVHPTIINTKAAIANTAASRPIQSTPWILADVVQLRTRSGCVGPLSRIRS